MRDKVSLEADEQRLRAAKARLQMEEAKLREVQDQVVHYEILMKDNPYPTHVKAFSRRIEEAKAELGFCKFLVDSLQDEVKNLELCSICKGAGILYTKGNDLIGDCFSCAGSGQNSKSEENINHFKDQIGMLLKAIDSDLMELDNLPLEQLEDLLNRILGDFEHDIQIRTTKIMELRAANPKTRKAAVRTQLMAEIIELKRQMVRRRRVDEFRYQAFIKMADQSPCHRCEHLGNKECQVCHGFGTEAAWRQACLEESQRDLHQKDEMLLGILGDEELSESNDTAVVCP